MKKIAVDNEVFKVDDDLVYKLMQYKNAATLLAHAYYLQERKKISATMLTNCLRQSYYNLSSQKTSSLKEDWRMFWGTLHHAGLAMSPEQRDKLADRGLLLEKTFERTFSYDGLVWEVEGTCDVINLRRKQILDYKTVTTDKLIKLMLESDYVRRLIMSSYTKQLNIYRLLVPYEISELTIAWHALEGEFLSGETYLIEEMPVGLQKQIKAYSKYDGQAEVSIPPVEIQNYEDVEEFVLGNSYALVEALKNKRPPSSKRMSKAFCAYCAYKDICNAK